MRTVGFQFESAQVALDTSEKSSSPKKYRVEAAILVKDIGDTPAYIDAVKKELYAIEADNKWNQIGGSTQESPNFDALGPKGEPLLLDFYSVFNEQDLEGDRSIVYRVEIRWHDAFNEAQPATVFCGILTDVSLPISTTRKLSVAPCIKGMSITTVSTR